MILDRHPSVLPAVTGGLDTVAIRVPAHPVALSLLESFGGGVAAPSANRFGRVSPTAAEDVENDLDGDVDLILDGGPCGIGLESTIVAWRGDGIVIARPGAIDAAAIAGASGCRVTTAEGDSVRAPGTLPSHYSPSTSIELCEPATLAERAAELAASGYRVGVLSLDPISAPGAVAAWHTGGNLDELARSLYRFLREADSLSLDWLVASLPPESGLGIAVADRLRRASQR
jgi:L-threonylcarbamoyladenylate synthase